MKTYFAKNEDVKNDWYVIDASGKTLGRVAAKAASVLRGKHKASYTPNSMCGDFVVIVNAEKIQVTGKKADNMLYRHYTGYVRGLRSYSFNTLIEKHPTEPLKRTIWECFLITALDARLSEILRFTKVQSILMQLRIQNLLKFKIGAYRD